jgi:predicted DNA binding CopG/RHH family protein
MKKQQNNPFDTVALDAEEKAIEEALDREEFTHDPDFKRTKAMLEEAATTYSKLHTAKPITIRVNQFDLIKVKAKAKREQIPYQTLLGSLIHQYAEGERDILL